MSYPPFFSFPDISSFPQMSYPDLSMSFPNIGMSFPDADPTCPGDGFEFDTDLAIDIQSFHDQCPHRGLKCHGTQMKASTSGDFPFGEDTVLVCTTDGSGHEISIQLVKIIAKLGSKYELELVLSGYDFNDITLYMRGETESGNFNFWDVSGTGTPSTGAFLSLGDYDSNNVVEFCMVVCIQDGNSPAAFGVGPGQTTGNSIADTGDGITSKDSGLAVEPEGGSDTVIKDNGVNSDGLYTPANTLALSMLGMASAIVIFVGFLFSERSTRFLVRSNDSNAMTDSSTSSTVFV